MTYTNGLKISKSKKDLIDLKNQNEKLINQNNNKDESLIQAKLKGFKDLSSLEDEKNDLEDQIQDLNKKICTKETFFLVIQKLEKQFNQGESLDQLKFALDMKLMELKRKTEEIDNLLTELNDTNLLNLKRKSTFFELINSGSEIILENWENILAKLNQDSRESFIKFKQEALIGHKESVLSLVKINETQIASGSADNFIKT